MWFIFLLAMMGFCILALTIIWIGSYVIRSIQREDVKFERENKEYQCFQNQPKNQKEN